MNNFRPVDRQTDFLLPPSVDEWLPERHLARFVVEVIEPLFVEVLALAREAGMLKLGMVARDGTKVHANASRHATAAFPHLAGAPPLPDVQFNAGADRPEGRRRRR